ncbi:Gfo/Idh/MocA family protein [Candidatus Poribacteria bacterium]
MVRIGVVGVGGMGKSHCNALGNVQDCQFTAVADVRSEVVEAVADQFKVKPFTDYHEMLDKVDAITVATPPWQHTEVTIDAAKSGVHVFCEKPLSATLADANAMVAATDDAGVVLMVGHVLRFYPLHELGRKMIDDGLIGNIVYVETDYCGKYSGPRNKPETWFGKMGGLLENGIHKVDLINWFGGAAETVAAEVGSFSGDEDWEDYTMSLIRYKSQTVGVLRWGQFMGARGSRGTIIDGSKGSMKLDMASGNVYHMLMGENEWTESVPADKGANGVVKELQHFVDSVRDGKNPISDGRDGRNAVEIVLATYKSAKEGTKVELPME